MNKIKPLIISRTPPYLGGREIMVNEIIKYFSQNNRVWVMTPDKYRNSSKVNIINKIGFNENLIRRLKRARINIVNCHTFYFFDTALKITKFLNIPLVFTLHGIFIGMYGKKYNSLIKKITEKSSLVITVSEMYLKKLKKNFPSKANKFIKIPNGIKTPKLRYENNINPCIKYIVIPARLNKMKGLEYIARASKKLKNIKFCICHPSGRKSDNKENKYKNKLLRESNNLLYFKRLNHKNMLLEIQKADLILLTSLIEGISISILESMSFGKIVAATRVGGNPEIIKDGWNGFLFKSRSSDSILKIVDRISKINLDGKKAISKNAILTVRNNFDINTMLNRYNNIFNNLISYENE